MLIRSVRVESPPVDRSGAVLPALIERFGEMDGFLVLESSWPGARASGHVSYAFLEPVLRISPVGGADALESPGSAPLACGGPLESLDGWVLPRLEASWPGSLEPVPLLAGYLSYELGALFERVGRPPLDAYGVPLYGLYLYSKVLVLPADPAQPPMLLSIDYEEAEPFWRAEGLEEILKCPPPAVRKAGSSAPEIDLEAELSPFSNASRDEYRSKVETIREMIRDGAVYQVNLSQQFRMPIGEAASSYYLRLRGINPSHYAAFMSCGGAQGRSRFAIASSSPELFLDGRDGRLRTSPIKGTRPRGRDACEDEMLRRELLSSEKDHAELAMIVDLERNDLGRIALPGSVRVDAHARLETHPHVHHLVSDVSCAIRGDTGALAILRALFPCGSITGAPKIAAMNAIADLEGTARGPYTGAIGAFGPRRLVKLNVAIRTAVIRERELLFQTGGGIVIDSDPAAEYEETLHKARGLYLAWLRDR